MPKPEGGCGFTAEDEELLSILAQHAAIALTNARLHERGRELTIAEERSRLAHELHDAVSQKLFSLRLTAQAAAALVDRDPARAKGELQQVADLAAEAVDELRAAVVELRPAALDEDGLIATLRTQVQVLDRAHAADVAFESRGVRALPAAQEEALLRVAQEALHNALRHSGAEHVTVTLTRRGPATVLRVCDDGRGFDPPPSGGRAATSASSPCATGRAASAADSPLPRSPARAPRSRWRSPVAEKIIRVLLVDDHQVVRRGLRTFLEIQEDIEVVGEASDGAEGVARTEELRPDVVLMDIKMPGTDGIEALRRLRELDNPARVLIVTSFTEQRTVVPPCAPEPPATCTRTWTRTPWPGRSARSTPATSCSSRRSRAHCWPRRRRARAPGGGAPSPNGNARSSASSRTAARTGRSPAPWSSPRRRSRRTCRTS